MQHAEKRKYCAGVLGQLRGRAAAQLRGNVGRHNVRNFVTGDGSLNFNGRFALRPAGQYVTTLLGNSNRPVELGNQKTCAEVKLRLFLIVSTLGIVFRKTKVLSSG